jgi:hypothetical protein
MTLEWDSLNTDTMATITYDWLEEGPSYVGHEFLHERGLDTVDQYRDPEVLQMVSDFYHQEIDTWVNAEERDYNGDEGNFGYNL